MQTLRFTYRMAESSFDLELESEGDRLTGSDLVLMGKYIHLLFITIRQIGATNSNIPVTDIDAMIRELMGGEDE